MACLASVPWFWGCSLREHWNLVYAWLSRVIRYSGGWKWRSEQKEKKEWIWESQRKVSGISSLKRNYEFSRNKKNKIDGQVDHFQGLENIQNSRWRQNAIRHRRVQDKILWDCSKTEETSCSVDKKPKCWGGKESIILPLPRGLHRPKPSYDSKARRRDGSLVFQFKLPQMRW